MIVIIYNIITILLLSFCLSLWKHEFNYVGHHVFLNKIYLFDLAYKRTKEIRYINLNDLSL